MQYNSPCQVSHLTPHNENKKSALSGQGPIDNAREKLLLPQDLHPPQHQQEEIST